MSNYQLRELRLENHTLNLYMSPERLFMPNAVTVRFSRAIKDVKDKSVVEIGTGVCPLAIWAALEGAKEVYAVDPVPEHIEVGQENVRKYALEERIHLYQGEFFSPFEGKGIKADIIIGDVSGIADKAARAVGWYPENVPTGGCDGSEITTRVIEQAPKFLAEGGALYFPVAIDLSNQKKIMDVAYENFSLIEEAFPSVWHLVLTQQQFRELMDSYDGTPPDFIKVGQKRGRYIWRGQIYKASQPKRA